MIVLHRAVSIGVGTGAGLRAPVPAQYFAMY